MAIRLSSVISFHLSLICVSILLYVLVISARAGWMVIAPVVLGEADLFSLESVKRLCLLIPFSVGYVLLGNAWLTWKDHFLIAFVYGASSGIGREIVEKLASQGVNVVLIALDDEWLVKTERELKGADLSLCSENYMPLIEQRTKDIDPNVIFLNAGYCILGYFCKTSVEKQVANVRCNTMSALTISSYFMRRMCEKKQKGLVCFTSSIASMLMVPSQATYNAAKAFLSTLTGCLAVEGYSYGIDVMAIHPGAVDTNFMAKNPKASSVATGDIDSVKFLLKSASTPQGLVSLLFSAIGRVTFFDPGPLALFLRTLSTRLTEVNYTQSFLKRVATFNSDYKRLVKAKLA